MTSNSNLTRITVLAILAVTSASGQAQEGLALKFGTWKLNVQRSKFAPGGVPQSDTRVYEDRGGGVIMSTHTTITTQGQEALTIYTAKFDGKDYPVVTRGSGVVSSISFQVIDAYSESFTLTRDGKVAVQGVTTVAKDGRTLTMTLNTTNARGQPFHGVSIYEKQ